MRIMYSALPPTQRSRSSRVNTIRQMGVAAPDDSALPTVTLGLSLMPSPPIAASRIVTWTPAPGGPTVAGSVSPFPLPVAGLEPRTGEAAQERG